MSRLSIGLALALLLFPASATLSAQYSFLVIPPTSSTFDAAVGEAQMSLEVVDGGEGTVFFNYSNTGPHASSITDIYVDDGSLLALVAIHNTAGSVEFSAYPSPPNLPRGENLTPPFEADQWFSADSDPPVQPMGINPYESLSIEYSLDEGAVFADVLGELASGELRIGIHVQGYDSGGSESFIVAEPVSFLAIALGVAGLLRRRQRSSLS